jgi:hypothetical protein
MLIAYSGDLLAVLQDVVVVAATTGKATTGKAR